jgi:hypothetical protein
MVLNEIGCECTDLICLEGSCGYKKEPFNSIKGMEFLGQQRNYQLL